MKLVKTIELAELEAIAIASELPLFVSDGHLIVYGDEPVEILLPACTPRLGKFTAFQVLLEIPNTILVAGVGSNDKYKSFNGTNWVESDDPVYQTPDVIRAGMERWMGPFQVQLKLLPLARLESVLIGFEVTVDLLDFIARNSLPQYLEIPTIYSIPATFTNGKSKIALPAIASVLEPSGVNRMKFHPLTGNVSLITVRSIAREGEDHLVQLTSSFTGSGYLDLELKPKVTYAEEGTYTQIEEIPTVILRRKELTEIGYPYHTFVAQGVIADFVSHTLLALDLLMTVTVVATSEGMANAIAMKLISKIQYDSGLAVPAFDMSFVVSMIKFPRSDRNAQGAKGSTPKTSFEFAVRNLYVLDS